MQPSETPKLAWTKVAMDLFEFDGSHYIVVVDYYSNFYEVELLRDLTAATTILRIKSIFARHGIPEIAVSDNGPQFVNAQFAAFATACRFRYVTSLPWYPQSNDKAESAVKICKTLIKKAKNSKSDTYLALLAYRATPSETLKSSHAQLLFGRRIRTQLPMKSSMLDPTPQSPAVIQGRIEETKEKQKARYDTKAKELPAIKPGDWLRMKRPGENEWSPARCLKKLSNRSFRVRCGDYVYRRNRRQLRLTSEENPSDEGEEQLELTPPVVQSQAKSNTPQQPTTQPESQQPEPQQPER